ncbi:MAG: hypothetical protein WB779_07560 [Ignavibacteriaceae bacterium]
MFTLKNSLIIFILIVLTSGMLQAQFVDNFDKKNIDGWFFFTGDGHATMDFVQKDGYATIVVDGRKDKDNCYWTLIKRDVTASLDMNKFKDPSYQLRVEAKVRLHNAPRRVNFMINTQRTTNFHIDLMEFDIPDTTDWHVISMTTKKFDVLPTDTVYVQLCVTDYGLDKYYADLDYYRADIVNVNEVGPDKGVLVPYHPPIPEVNTFSNHLDVAGDCLINTDYPNVNFNNWSVKEKDGDARILTVNGNQWAILRWDFEKYKNMKVDGAGLLELTTQSVTKGGNYTEAYGQNFGEEFGKVRVIEILGGESEWDQNKVTYNNLTKNKDYSDVFNTQMVYDTELSEERGGRNLITISRPVLQRLIDGKTKGLLIRPLGAIDASFYASENESGSEGPKLHFNVEW